MVNINRVLGCQGFVRSNHRLPLILMRSNAPPRIPSPPSSLLSRLILVVCTMHFASDSLPRDTSIEMRNHELPPHVPKLYFVFMSNNYFNLPISRSLKIKWNVQLKPSIPLSSRLIQTLQISHANQKAILDCASTKITTILYFLEQEKSLIIARLVTLVAQASSRIW